MFLQVAKIQLQIFFCSLVIVFTHDLHSHMVMQIVLYVSVIFMWRVLLIPKKRILALVKSVSGYFD